MPAAPMIAMAVMMAAQAATTAYTMTNTGGQGGKGPIGGGPKPIMDLTPEEIQNNRTKFGNTSMPAFLGLPTAMTPMQQRTAIAQGGVSGGDPRYRDPETARYYSSLLYKDPTLDTGGLSDVDKQYIKSLGGSPLNESSGTSYLSALERSIGSM